MSLAKRTAMRSLETASLTRNGASFSSYRLAGWCDAMGARETCLRNSSWLSSTKQMRSERFFVFSLMTPTLAGHQSSTTLALQRTWKGRSCSR